MVKAANIATTWEPYLVTWALVKAKFYFIEILCISLLYVLKYTHKDLKHFMQ